MTMTYVGAGMVAAQHQVHLCMDEGFCGLDFIYGSTSAVAFSVTLSTFLALAVGRVAADEIRDTREGETVTLKCRFSEQSAASDFSYYWARSTGNKFDNVAIKGVQLNTNYR
uniref:Ig-like domain-containing protein n=1 Tax=Anopheles dirus TaxID=7168 RepID=A0A182N8L6_9DIPT